MQGIYLHHLFTELHHCPYITPESTQTSPSCWTYLIQLHQKLQCKTTASGFPVAARLHGLTNLSMFIKSKPSNQAKELRSNDGSNILWPGKDRRRSTYKQKTLSESWSDLFELLHSSLSDKISFHRQRQVRSQCCHFYHLLSESSYNFLIVAPRLLRSVHSSWFWLALWD